MPERSTNFLGLRTVVYHTPDIARAKAWYADALGTQPYFDEPFYVGFNVGGFELGLDPDASGPPTSQGGAVAYWGVTDCAQEFQRLLDLGAKLHHEIQEVGGGIKVASVFDPFNNILGIIENSHFPNEA